MRQPRCPVTSVKTLDVPIPRSFPLVEDELLTTVTRHRMAGDWSHFNHTEYVEHGALDSVSSQRVASTCQSSAPSSELKEKFPLPPLPSESFLSFDKSSLVQVQDTTRVVGDAANGVVGDNVVTSAFIRLPPRSALFSRFSPRPARIFFRRRTSRRRTALYEKYIRSLKKKLMNAEKSYVAIQIQVDVAVSREADREPQWREPLERLLYGRRRTGVVWTDR